MRRVQLGAAQLHHRSFRPRRHPLQPPRQLPIAGVTQRHRLAVELGDFLPHARVIPRRCAVARSDFASSTSSRHCISTPRSPPPPERSNISVVIATCQPWFFSPTRFFFGTRTSSKKTSLKPLLPVICTSGRDRHPGAVHIDHQVADSLMLGRVGIGAHQQEDPVGILRDRRPHFLPVDDEVVAVLDRARLQRARSEPEPGSEYPWHQTSSAFMIGGIKRCFCSSVPQCNSVGPNMVVPIPIIGAATPARASSSL